MIAVCPTEQRLREFSLGQLDEEQSDLLFSHVSDCHDCQQLLSEDNIEDTLTKQLRETREVETDSPNFANEVECQAAMTKALSALADVSSSGEFSEQKLPEKIGDYQIVGQIGRGGMGNVYLARHSKLGTQVALKVIAAHRVGDPLMHGRFESELLALGKLDHPNIVRALDAREEDGVLVLVTEYIEGLDLGAIIRRTGPLNFADAAKVVEQVSQALIAIDQANMVHRDVKPSNIMINTDGGVKLLDLGLARLQGDGMHREFTMTGQAIGTVDYLAPEQINGKGSVDIRTDIYALGCTLFKLLTGNVPFGDPDHSTSFAKMTAHVSEGRPKINQADVPAELVALTTQMMSVNPESRPTRPNDVAKSVAELARQSDLSSMVRDAMAAEPNQYKNEASANYQRDQQESKLTALPWWRRRVPISIAIASGLAGLLVGLLFSIIITIKNPDGSITKMVIPDGSQVTIEQGGITAQDGTAETSRDFPPEGDSQLYPSINPSINPERGSFGGKISNDATAAPNLNPVPLLKGIWKLELQRKVEPGEVTPVLDSKGPNLLMIGEESVAMFRDNELMATGSIAFHDDALIPGIELRLGPPDGIAIPKGSTFFAPRFTICTPGFSGRDNVILSNMNDGNGTLIPAQFALSRVKIPGDIQDFPRFLTNKKSASRYSNVRAAMKMLYELEYEELNLPDDDSSESTKTKSQKKLRVLTIGFHNYAHAYQINNKSIFPASKNTTARARTIPTDRRPSQEGLDEGRQQQENIPARTQNDSVMQDREIASKSTDPNPTTEATAIEKLEHPYSWRVAILPFIDQSELYNQYRFEESWDSTHNQTLLKQMPEIFRYPDDAKDTYKTRYLGVSGPHGAMGLEDGVAIRDVSDGTSNSILLIESALTVPWTKPQDLVFDPEDPFQPNIDWFVSRTSNVAFADGSTGVLKLTNESDGAILKAFLMIDDGSVQDRFTSGIFEE